LVHQYETLWRKNTSTISFKATKRRFGKVLIFSERIFGKQKGSKLWGSCKQLYAELPESRLQHVTKSTLPSLRFGFFPENCGVVNDEHESFHQGISCIEKWHQGKWNCDMLANYCWTLARDVPAMEYKRKAKRGEKKHIILCVLNNELTWKRLCKCSIYAVNIIPKQNKSTKHIVFYWIVFSLYLIHRSVYYVNLFPNIS